MSALRTPAGNGQCPFQTLLQLAMYFEGCLDTARDLENGWEFYIMPLKTGSRSTPMVSIGYRLKQLIKQSTADNL
nr:hypothetical protein [Nitrosomonas aestuarii]